MRRGKERKGKGIESSTLSLNLFFTALIRVLDHKEDSGDSLLFLTQDGLLNINKTSMKN